jgi:hypothetical protein
MASSDENPYASPRIPPKSDDPSLERPKHYMSPAPQEYGEGVGDDHSPMGGFALRMYLILGAASAVAFTGLAVTYPMTWAVLTTVILGMSLGLLTAKVVVRIESPLKMCCLAPLFGLGWMLLLLAVYQLRSLF